jgi:hypothetical protein
MTFKNVAFVQQGGPLTSTVNGVQQLSGVTATINVRANNSTFDGCYFIWDGQAPTYYTVYLYGSNTTIKNSKFAKGLGGYTAQPRKLANGSWEAPTPTYVNNIDYDTGKPISLPDYTL